MEDLNYNQLKEYIAGNIRELLDDGLSIRQAIARMQSEYANLVEESEMVRLVIYMILYKEGLKHDFYQEDMKNEISRIVSERNFRDIEYELNQEVFLPFREDIDEFRKSNRVG